MADERSLDPGAFFDLTRQNPWWHETSALPGRGDPRADLYWRVRNTLENDLLIIPGPPVTGTTATLRQIIRALARGVDFDHHRIGSLFEDANRPEAYEPRQLCYVDCADPIAYLDESFIENVRRTYHPTGARTGTLAYFLFFDGIHHIEHWREQLLAASEYLRTEFPERWTLVATVPVRELAQAFDDEAVTVDRPHLPQKYRDALCHEASELQDTLRPGSTTGNDPIEQVRTQFRAGANGETSAEELQDAFRAVINPIRDIDGLPSTVTARYLTDGGFGPALDRTAPTPAAIGNHVNHSLERTIYRDLPRLGTYDERIPRIARPEELHALIALLARRQYRETSYLDLGEFLSCDTRTIRQKYVPLLEQLHLGERATRYDLERNRSLRFFPRGPGYATAFRGTGVTDADRTDRLRIALADHLRRLLARLGGSGGLQYWHGETDQVVDFLLELDGHPVPMVSSFAEDVGGTPAALDAFATAESPKLEIVIDDADTRVEIEPVGDRLRVTVPHWGLLAIC